VTLDLQKDWANFPPTEIPPGFRGWMRVTSATPIAVMSFVDVASQMMAVSAFEGIPAERASTKLLVPRVRRSSEANTSMVLLTHHEAEASFTIQYLGWAGVCVNEPLAETHVIGAGEVLTVGPGADSVTSPLPDDCSASAVIVSDAPLTGIAMERDLVDLGGRKAGREAAYVMPRPEDTAKRVLVPTFRKRVGTRSSMLWALNTGLASATATLALYDAEGQPITTCGDACVAEIGPNSVREWPAEDLDAYPDGTDGRAILTSTEPIVTAVGEAGQRLDLTLLRGIPADAPSRAADGQPMQQSWVPLLLAGECAPPTPTATPGTAVTPIPSLTPTASPTPSCTTHDTDMTISASATEIRVGEPVTVTARLANVGCANIGLMLYRLGQRPLGIRMLADEPLAALAPTSPITVSHPFGLGTGQPDEVRFVLRGVRPGADDLSATVSFEVHLGYPGPAYWAGDAAGPITVRVRSIASPAVLPFLARNYALLVPARE
jgi:hypothetical protein